MKNKIMSLVAFVFVVCTIMSTSSLAARSIVSLPANQVWVYRTLTRSGNYSYLNVNLHDVYPESGFDTYTRIQVQMTNTSNVNIAVGTPTVIYEGQGLYKYHLREGYVSTKTIRFQFRGNSSKPALADVTYLAN